MEKIRQDVLGLFSVGAKTLSSYTAPSTSYEQPSVAAATYEEPSPVYSAAPSDVYAEPIDTTYNNHKQTVVQREPMLQRFMKDIDVFNKWLARQTLETFNNGQRFKLPFDLPELPASSSIQKIKRQDPVMRYVSSPNLGSQVQEQQQPLAQELSPVAVQEEPTAR